MERIETAQRDQDASDPSSYEIVAELKALLPALEQREREIRHNTVTRINKLLGIASNVDLERWEQLKERINRLEQRERELRIMEAEYIAAG